MQSAVSFHLIHFRIVAFFVVSSGFSTEENTDFRNSSKCVTYDWDRYMICRWCVPKGYWINVTWQKIRFPEIYACPKATLNSCTWNISQGDVDPSQTLNLFVKLSNSTFRQNFSERIVIQDTVKPSPVSAVAAKASREDCVFVQWYYVNNFKQKRFRIRYYCGTTDQEQTADELISDESDKPSFSKDAIPYDYELCGLRFNCHYTIMVDCSPWRKGYWSEAREAVVLTNKAVPSFPPTVIPGCFTMSSVNQNGTRLLTLYWKKLNETDWNGDKGGYEASILPDQSCHLPDERINSTDAFFTKEVSSLCAYTVKLWSKNEIGRSTQYSTVYMDISVDDKRIPRDIYVKGINQDSGRVQLYWSSPKYFPRALNDSFTVFWCKKGTGLNCMRNTDIHYASVSSDTYSIDIEMVGFPSTSYIYGVSAGSSNKRSGFRWSSCSMIQDNFHPPAIHFESGEDEVTVSWTYSFCDNKRRVEDERLVDWVHICQSEACSDFNRVAILRHTRHLVVDLAAGKSLCLSIALYRNEKVLIESEIRCFTQPLENMQKDILKTVVIITITCACIIFTALIVCYHVQIKKKCSEEFEIELPSIKTDSLKQNNDLIRSLIEVPESSVTTTNSNQSTSYVPQSALIP